ncbi:MULTISPECIES: hypothetical protein [Chryseobacterium]|uniref:Uncharacterized protein n=1 Tax=Chryseobacterium endophyticum TaxID=1854762 RepID=A0AAU6WKN6_9FLAO
MDLFTIKYSTFHVNKVSFVIFVVIIGQFIEKGGLGSAQPPDGHSFTDANEKIFDF